MTDQVSTTLVLAATTARSRSERIVIEAAQWSGEQIRLAGAEASRLVLAQMETPVAHSRSAARTATIAAWISGSAAICAVLAIVWLVR
jgi:hypothetical protein